MRIIIWFKLELFYTKGEHIHSHKEKVKSEMIRCESNKYEERNTNHFFFPVSRHLGEWKIFPSPATGIFMIGLHAAFS